MTRVEMRQLLHMAIGLFFWILLLVMWGMLVTDDKVGVRNVADSIQYVGIVAAAVLAITLWWIRHNKRIYRRKGPRVGRPALAAPVDEDRLGRPVRWQVAGGAGGAAAMGHLVIELEGPAKVYSAGA